MELRGINRYSRKPEKLPKEKRFSLQKTLASTRYEMLDIAILIALCSCLPKKLFEDKARSGELLKKL